MVFDPAVAPRERENFMTWYWNFVKWDEPNRNYNSADGMTGNLRAFYDDMRTVLPAMNGPFAADIDSIEDESLLSDYNCGSSGIYITFAWSKAELAYETTREMARRHSVGFFDVSANDGDIIHDWPQSLSEATRSEKRSWIARFFGRLSS